MNPARTLAPAVASKIYSGLWVYFLGPPIGTLSGAWAYNYIRLNDMSPQQAEKLSSFKLRRLQSQASPQVGGGDELDNL